MRFFVLLTSLAASFAQPAGAEVSPPLQLLEQRLAAMARVGTHKQDSQSCFDLIQAPRQREYEFERVLVE